MNKFLNEIEKKEAKVAMLDLLKIAFFIGFIPSIVALLGDLGLLSSTTSKDLKGFTEIMKTLIPSNEIYIYVLGSYTTFHMVFLFVLAICIHLEKKIFPQILSFCELFSPVAEVLLQVIAVIAGLFFTLALLVMLSDQPSSSIIFLILSLFLLFLSTTALTINRVITHNYKSLSDIDTVILPKK